MEQTSSRPIVLWTVPRAVSTAFERAVRTLPDVRVFHEPFTQPYYFGPERVSARYLQQTPDPAKTYAQTTAGLLDQQGEFRAIFVKAMAYCAADVLELDTLDRFVNTFLIRDPRRSIPSLYRMSLDERATGWTYFDVQEAGFHELSRIYSDACHKLGQPSVVIDAADLLARPEDILKAYCERVGLPFRPSMLQWGSDPVDEWSVWNGWHGETRKSTGFAQPPASSPPVRDDLPDIVKAAIDDCMPSYQAMYENRLRP